MALISHIALHTKIESGYQCLFCEKHFGNLRFRKHLKFDLTLTKFVCCLCQKRFHWKCEWETHACSGLENDADNGFMPEYSRIESVVDTSNPSGDFGDVQGMSNDASGDSVNDSVDRMGLAIGNSFSVKPIGFSEDDAETGLDSPVVDFGDMVATLKNFGCGTGQIGDESSGIKLFPKPSEVIQPVEQYAGHHTLSKESSNGTIDKPVLDMPQNVHMQGAIDISHSVVCQNRVRSPVSILQKHFQSGKLRSKKHLQFDLNLTKFVCWSCQKNGFITGYSIVESVLGTNRPSGDWGCTHNV